jgi:hypothetical protein
MILAYHYNQAVWSAGRQARVIAAVPVGRVGGPRASAQYIAVYIRLLRTRFEKGAAGNCFLRLADTRHI